MTSRRAVPSQRRPSSAERVAAALVVALGEAIVLIVAGTTIIASSAGYDIPVTSAEGVVGTVTFVTVGGFLILKVPRNVVGWLLWTSGLFLAISFGAGYLASEGLTNRPGSVIGAIWFAWLSNWIAAPGLLLGAGILPLFFPTGRPLSRRWRAVAIAGLVVIATGVLAAVFGHFKPGAYPAGIDSPIALGGSVGDLLKMAGGVMYGIFALALFPLGVASLVVRHRRSTDLERRQLTPFAVLAGVIVGALVLAFAGAGEGAWFVAVGGLVFLPLTIAIAVLRYGLYDIELIINRTIVYGLATAILAGSYAALISLLQRIFIAVTGATSDAAIVLTTLVVVSLFTPVRSRLQTIVDQRFKEHSDPTRAILAFADAVESRVSPLDLDYVAERLLRIATSSFNAVVGSVRLASGQQTRVVASTTSEANLSDMVPRTEPFEAELEVSGDGGASTLVVALGARRGGAPYLERDRSALAAAVTAVTQALTIDGTLVAAQAAQGRPGTGSAAGEAGPT